MSVHNRVVAAPTFGDRVRVKPTDETVAHGSAGQFGEVFGESIPSGTGIDYGPVIGGLAEDRLLRVKLDSGVEEWFAPSLVEFIDHRAGSVISLDGGPTFRRLEDGTWQQVGGRTEVGEFLNPTGGVPRRTRPGVFAAFLRWFDRGRKN
jgi:hypothetical protein